MYLSVTESSGDLLGLSCGGSGVADCFHASSSGGRRIGNGAHEGLLAGSSRRRGGGSHADDGLLTHSGGARCWDSGVNEGLLAGRSRRRVWGSCADDGLLADSSKAWDRGGRKAAPQGQLHLQDRQFGVAFDQETGLLLDFTASCAVAMSTHHNCAPGTPKYYCSTCWQTVFCNILMTHIARRMAQSRHHDAMRSQQIGAAGIEASRISKTPADHLI